MRQCLSLSGGDSQMRLLYQEAYDSTIAWAEQVDVSLIRQRIDAIFALQGGNKQHLGSVMSAERCAGVVDACTDMLMLLSPVCVPIKALTS